MVSGIVILADSPLELWLQMNLIAVNDRLMVLECRHKRCKPFYVVLTVFHKDVTKIWGPHLLFLSSRMPTERWGAIILAACFFYQVITCLQIFIAHASRTCEAHGIGCFVLWVFPFWPSLATTRYHTCYNFCLLVKRKLTLASHIVTETHRLRPYWPFQWGFRVVVVFFLSISLVLLCHSFLSWF